MAGTNKTYTDRNEWVGLDDLGAIALASEAGSRNPNPTILPVRSYTAADAPGIDDDYRNALINMAARGNTSPTTGGGSGGGYGGYLSGNAYRPSAYESRYQADIDRILGQLANRRFSYNYETDPLFQQYRKQYTIGGERAMEDTLGRVAARTGGLASSYAGSAAQQAYNEYMTALSGKIPELQQIAYNMYKNEGNDLMNMLNAYRNLENDNYDRFNNEENRLLQAMKSSSGGYVKGNQNNGDSSASEEETAEPATRVSSSFSPSIAAALNNYYSGNRNQQTKYEPLAMNYTTAFYALKNAGGSPIEKIDQIQKWEKQGRINEATAQRLLDEGI